MKTDNNTSRRDFMKASGTATLAAGLSASVLSSFANDPVVYTRNFQSENAGGHYNHELFPEIIAPQSSKPSPSELSKTIIRNFNSIDIFKAQFSGTI